MRRLLALRSFRSQRPASWGAPPKPAAGTMDLSIGTCLAKRMPNGKNLGCSRAAGENGTR